MRLKLIKDWGQYKIGDVILDPSPSTLEALTRTYKVAVEVEEEEVKIVKKGRKSRIKEKVTEEVVEAKEDREMTEEEKEEEAKIDKEASEEVKEEVKIEEETVESDFPPEKKETASKEVSKKSKK